MTWQDESLILTDRQNAILRAVVEEYIASAQPVSSSTIAEQPGINASSATIRNEMVRLEECGLLLQPYTSAGRIPTDTGYRYYVDHLIIAFQVQGQSAPALPPVRDPGVEATCRLLGELTKYTALALVANWQEQHLQHIELAPVGDDQLLIMLIAENRQILHSLTTIPERPSPARLRQLNDLLNNEFVGKPFSALTDEALAQAVARLPHVPSQFYREALALVRQGIEQSSLETRMHIEGTTYLFEQQDFSDLPKLRALMAALQEESVFETLFSRSIPGEITVSIGAENPPPRPGRLRDRLHQLSTERPCNRTGWRAGTKTYALPQCHPHH